jgi:hypothetical protein
LDSTSRDPWADLGVRAADDLHARLPNQKRPFLFWIDDEVGDQPGEPGSREELVVAVAGDFGVVGGALGDGVIGEPVARTGGSESHQHGHRLRRLNKEIGLMRSK